MYGFEDDRPLKERVQVEKEVKEVYWISLDGDNNLKIERITPNTTAITSLGTSQTVYLNNLYIPSLIEILTQIHS